MLWWHSWTWWFGVYQWLELNNLWKAAVGFGVTIVMSAVLALLLRPWRLWKQRKDDRETQRRIADQLDTTTPGGLTELVEALREVLDQLAGGDAPDDNGSDGPPQRKRQPARHHESPEIPEGRHGGSFPGPMHGGGSAGHR